MNVFPENLSIDIQTKYPNGFTTGEIASVFKRDEIYEIACCAIEDQGWRNEYPKLFKAIVCRLELDMSQGKILPKYINQITNLSLKHLVNRSVVSFASGKSNLYLDNFMISSIRKSIYLIETNGNYHIDDNFFKLLNDNNNVVDERLLKDPLQLYKAIMLSRNFNSSFENDLKEITIDENNFYAFLNTSIIMNDVEWFNKCAKYLFLKTEMFSTFKFNKIRIKVSSNLDIALQHLALFPRKKLEIIFEPDQNITFDDFNNFNKTYCDAIHSIILSKSSFSTIPNINNLINLKTIKVDTCDQFTYLSDFENLTNLKKIIIKNCVKFEKIPGLKNLHELTIVDFSLCSNLKSNVDFENLPNLVSFNLKGVNSLKVSEKIIILLTLTRAGAAIEDDLNTAYSIKFEMFDFLTKYSNYQNDKYEKLNNEINYITENLKTIQNIPDDHNYNYCCMMVPLFYSFIEKSDIIDQISIDIIKSNMFDLDSMRKIVNNNKYFLDFFIKKLDKVPLNDLETLIDIKNLQQEYLNERILSFWIEYYSDTLEEMYNYNNDFSNLIKDYFISSEGKETFFNLLEKMSIHAPYFLNSVMKTKEIKEKFSNFISTEHGRSLIINQKYQYFLHCDHICSIITSVYPQDLLGNAIYYPTIKAAIKQRSTYISGEVGDYQTVNQLEIDCYYSDPERKPFEMLKILADNIKKDPDTLCIQFYGQIGIDHGALSADFLTRLFVELSKRLEFKDTIPAWKEENNAILLDLGTVFMFLPFIDIQIGEVFPPLLFKLLLQFNYEEIKGDFAKISNRKIFNMYMNYLRESALEKVGTDLDEIQKIVFGEFSQSIFTTDEIKIKEETHLIQLIETYYKALYLDYPSGLMVSSEGKIMNPAQLPLYIDQIKEVLIGECIALHKQMFQTIYTVAKGMITDSFTWKDLQNRKDEYLISHILGKFDRQGLIDVLEFNSEITEEMKRYFFEWIESKSDAELKRFLFYVTGSPVVPRVRKISVEVKETIQSLDVTACSYRIDMPPLSGEGKNLLFVNLDYFCNESQSNQDKGFTQR